MLCCRLTKCKEDAGETIDGVYYAFENETITSIALEIWPDHQSPFDAADLLLQNVPVHEGLTLTSALQCGTALRVPGENNNFCLCNQPSEKNDLQCGECCAWFHQECVDIPEGVVVASDEFTFLCPRCQKKEQQRVVRAQNRDAAKQKELARQVAAATESTKEVEDAGGRRSRAGRRG